MIGNLQKILKKNKIRNDEIAGVINNYKKYSNPNKLSQGKKIDIVIEKNISGDNYSILKFTYPITKSTSIEITKNEDNKIISNKIGGSSSIK